MKKFYEELIKYPCQEYGVSETPPPEYRDMFNKFQKEVFDTNLVIGETSQIL